MNIFLSYGHDIFTVLAERLKNDLSNLGYPTWFDKDALRSSVTWQNKIEEAIMSSEWLILLMTAHSMRRPDGVCLDEVSMARGRKKSILPIMLQRVTPPLSIVRLQYMSLEGLCTSDGHINEELYKETLDRIVEILEGEAELSCEGVQQTLLSCLEPLDNDVYFTAFKSGFTGREWLFDKYDEWVKDKASKLFILLGKPGTGKSAFASNLCVQRSEICGIHFCRYNNCERSDPKRAIMSLAYHLATQIPEYAQSLVLLNDLDSLKDKSIQRLFEYIFTEPLASIKWDKNPIVLVIDAVDEADNDGKNALLEVIVDCFHNTPQWLKLLVTARPEAEIVRKFKRFSPTVVDSYDENNEDICKYYQNALSTAEVAFTNEHIRQLCCICQGSFLYATEIIKDIAASRLSLSDIGNFPLGMSEKYARDFERLFPEKAVYRETIAALLEILTARQVPMTIADAAEILDEDENDIEDNYETICTLFPKENNYIMPIHKSLYDWLINRDMAGNYTISSAKGHKALCAYYGKFFERNRLTDAYAVKYLARHYIHSKDYERAAEVLTANEWQDKRKSMLGLDSFMHAYLSEVEMIAQKDQAYAYYILQSPYFLELMVKNRFYLYSSGLYFQMMACGFDNIEDNVEKTSFETISSIAFYYYITERYKKAESLFIDAIEKGGEIPDPSKEDRLLIASLCNTLGLCYRKYADFETANYWFNLAAEKADGVSDGEYSGAQLNTGKICYHMLDFEKALELGNLALERLTKSVESIADDDTRKTYRLFIAECHRLIAESVIWEPRPELAREHLDAAGKIYEEESSRDRYYVRYRYSDMLCHILDGDAEAALIISDEIWQDARSSYDKVQILYYKALAALCTGKKDECDRLCNEALSLAGDLEIPLEMQEIKTLQGICNDADSVQCVTSGSAIVVWCKHVEGVIRETLGAKYGN